MSRSHRYHPIFGWTTATSEKDDKRRANKRQRLEIKQAARTCEDFDDVMLPKRRETSNVYWFAKDGKSYWTSSEFQDVVRKSERTRKQWMGK